MRRDAVGFKTVPWCEPCGKFYSPNTLKADGTCPEHHQVADPTARRLKPGTSGTDTVEDPARVPWHFWLLATGVIVYLGWRLIQLILWMF